MVMWFPIPWIFLIVQYYSVVVLRYVFLSFLQNIFSMRESIWFHLWWFPFIWLIPIIYLLSSDNAMFYSLCLVFDYFSLWNTSIIFDMYILKLEINFFKYFLVTFLNLFFIIFLKMQHDPIHEIITFLFNPILHFWFTSSIFRDIWPSCKFVLQVFW